MESPNALKNAFAPIFSLTQKEWLIGTRSSAFRLLAVCAALLGFAVGGSPGRGAGQSAYEIAESAWQNLGFVAIAWVSISAVRESLMRTDRIVFSKPQPVERLVLAKFLGATGRFSLCCLRCLRAESYRICSRAAGFSARKSI